MSGNGMWQIAACQNVAELMNFNFDLPNSRQISVLAGKKNAAD
jgi:hypothetical protein